MRERGKQGEEGELKRDEVRGESDTHARERTA